jgi:splicing factor 3B subunit 3
MILARYNLNNSDFLVLDIIVAGIEKQKFVYVMNRDSANRLTISSPLEAHKSDTILFSVCGVDVGFDNPVFAMIELEYTEADQDPSGEAAQEVEKKLTYYELDLGLNHVVRKWSEPISRTANLLLTVPGGDDGPSGVLICGENWVSYKNQGHIEVRTALPRRHDMPPERGLLITTGTVHKQKDLYFFMLQSELGDLYKVTIETDPSDPKIVQNIVVTVFDSIQPANSLCITKTGLLFVASEFGNHGLFQFQGIGDDPDAVRSERIMDEELNEELGDDSQSAAKVAPKFKPSAKLQNLLLTDDMDSLAPITDMMVDDVAGEETQQIVTLCGKGNRSTLRVLRHGVSVTEMAVSELPGKPSAVWTVRASQDSEQDRYIVVSFPNATLVLSIGENVEEVTDSGFLASASTLQVVLLADNALLQVHANGIRHIRPDQRTSEWKTPGRRIIERAAANSRQVVISLAGGEIIYFELDAAGQLMEMGTLDLGKEVSCLDMGVVPDGRVRSSFLAVGCWDDTVQLLSLDPSDVLAQRSALSLPARPDSVCLVQMTKERGGSASGSADGVPTLYLNVGLSTGVLIRVAVDPIVGQLSDSRQRFLGSKSIKLFRVIVHGQQGVLALTTRAWLMYTYQGRYFQAPVSYEALEYASNFSSEMCPEGIVAVAGNTLRIVTVDNLGAMFNQTTFPLRYTPRKMCRIPNTRQIVIVETDQHEYNEAERATLAATSSSSASSAFGSMQMETSEEKGAGGEDDEDEGTIMPVRGPLPPLDGKWASCIRVIEPATGTSREVLELSNNEAAFSVCTCRFTNHSEETFVIVGTAKDLVLHPRQAQSCSIHVYRILDGRLQLLHQTEVDDVPLSMSEFQGKLLVGVGKTLRLYELGKRKLLKKSENKCFPVAIVRIQCNGDRIYVGDICDSVHFVKYKRSENVLSVFCDDTTPR